MTFKEGDHVQLKTGGAESGLDIADQMSAMGQYPPKSNVCVLGGAGVRQKVRLTRPQRFAVFYLPSSGSLAILLAIRRASSFVSSLAAERRPGSFS
jgi:hypothetical protein